MTLRSKIFIAALVPTAVALAAFGWLAASRSQESLGSDIDTRLRDRAMVLARAVDRSVGSRVFFTPDEQRSGKQFTEEVLSPAGEVKWQSGARDRLPLPRPTAMPALTWQNRLHLETLENTGGERMRVATIGVPGTMPDGDRIEVKWLGRTALPLTETDQRLEALRQWLGAAGAGALGFSAAAVWFLMREWLRGYRAVTGAARQLMADPEAHARLPVPESDAEMATLARDFNAVLARLEKVLTSQRQFTSDASHELRTPLAILRSELEVVLRRERSSEQYRDSLVSCRKETERLSRLIENLLALARADAGQPLGESEPVNLAALAGEICERFQPIAAAREVSLTWTADGPSEVAADKLALERVLTNLLENALRHTPAGEGVHVSVEGTDGDVRLEVTDQGPGIAPEHMPHLFERFFRADAARSSQHGGAGLGLAIVKTLVEAHGGRIEVRSEFGKGASFIITLPRHVAPPDQDLPIAE